MEPLKIFVIAGSLFMVGLGLLSFNLDLMWRLTQIRDRFWGLEPQRTQHWETKTRVGGIGLLILGLIILLATLSGSISFQ